MDLYWAGFGEGHPMLTASTFPGCNSNFTAGIPINLLDDNSNQAPPFDSPLVMPAARPGKKVVGRDRNFSHREDELMCAAYANVSKDPVTGINQTSGGYWNQFHEFFHAHKDFKSVQTPASTKHRWMAIQKETTKFCAYKEKIDRRNESGKGEQDRVNDALKMFNDLEGHPFHFLHCWMLLKNERKWSDQLLANSRDNQDPLKGTSSQGGTAGTNEPVDLDSAGHDSGGGSRPMGRDAAKKRRAHASTGSSSSSPAVQVLERMTINRELVELKRQDQIAEFLAREDRTLQLKEREISLRERQAAIQETHTLALEKAEEARIMSIDVEKIPKWQREYYISQQQEIVNKHRSRSRGESG